MLLDYYYTIKGQQTTGDTTLFYVSLINNCDIYNGHFPDMPVAPGVCNIQMIKECTERLTGKQLLLEYITQCKLTTLITPQQHPELEIRIQILEKDETQIKIKAVIGQDNSEYLTLRSCFEFYNK